MGTTCGRREREAGAGNEEERSSRVPAAATVEGTLVHGMPTAFAGCRRNAGLGRSVSSVGGSFPCRRSHRRQQVSSGRMRRGTSSACAKRTHSSRAAPKKRSRARGHVLRSVQRPVHVNRHSTHLGAAQAQPGWGVAAVEISRSGKPAQAGGTGTGVTIDRTLRGSPRVTASLLRSRSSRGSCVTRQKRKVVMVTVPARNRESGVFRPYVVSSCRSRQAASGLE